MRFFINIMYVTHYWSFPTHHDICLYIKEDDLKQVSSTFIIHRNWRPIPYYKKQKNSLWFHDRHNETTPEKSRYLTNSSIFLSAVLV